MFSAYKNQLGRHAFVVALSVGVIAIGGNATLARNTDSWPVEGRLIGEIRDADYKKSKDVSGIACATATGLPRTCLLADDESQGAQIVIVDDGRVIAGDFIRLIYNSYDNTPLELDAEGVAYADGSFYVIGSHGRPRHEKNESEKDRQRNDAQAEASRHLFRIRFDPHAVDRDGRLRGAVEIKPSTELSKFIRAEPALLPFFNGKLQDRGLTIEGVSVRAGRLYAGMREPVLDDGQAAILSVSLGALFEGEAGTGHLHRLNLGKRRGVRDLVEHENSFLVLAGPTDDPENGEVNDGDYSVVWWDGNGQLKRLCDLESYGRKVKPEALLPLGRSGDKLRVLMFFDGPDAGAPRLVEVDHP